MEDDVLDILEQLGYSGPLIEKDKLLAAVKIGPKSIEYTQLVEFLSKELSRLSKLEESVNAITSVEDSSSFLLEVSSFLKELNCPHKSLTNEGVNQRLQTIESRLLLLVYLGGELQAARLISHNEISSNKAMEVGISESPTARDLKNLLITLGVSKPPPDVTLSKLFSKIESKIKERLNTIPADALQKPLFSGLLSPKQWNSLTQLYNEMFEDYSFRRQMLLKRLDVTVQSFQWSGKAKMSKDSIASTFGPARRNLSTEPNVSIASLLAAREDLTILEKTSSSNVRKNTQCAVNKVLIGRVPDRGGRPSEQQPPPPEMPSWQKRVEPAGGQAAGGGGGSGRGRIQGGWSSNQNQGHYQGGYQNDRGGGRGGRGGRGGGRQQDHHYGGDQYSNRSNQGYY